MESVSENLLMNLSIKNRSSNETHNQDLSNSCCLRDSLQIQHSTNLNIQRSQSTQRFTNNIVENNRASSSAGTSISQGVCAGQAQMEHLLDALSQFHDSCSQIGYVGSLDQQNIVTGKFIFYIFILYFSYLLSTNMNLLNLFI